MYIQYTILNILCYTVGPSCLSIFSGGHCARHVDLSSLIKGWQSSALEAWSLNHWATKEDPIHSFISYGNIIKNVLLVSGAQQSDSAIYRHVSILFQVLSLFRLLQNTEQSSPRYTIGPCLSILYITICIC